MSFWQKVKDWGFTIPILKIEFSTGGGKVVVHKVTVPVAEGVKKVKETLKGKKK